MKSQSNLARKEQIIQERVKTKPRYTPEENELIYENWWNPKLRKELSHRFNRKISALRSQFCRLLKERNVSNDEYYRMMRAKYMSGKVKDIVSGDEDDIILQVFAKNQVLGSTRNDACSELREVLKRDLSDAALKLRFYRLVQKRGLDEDEIYQLGQQVIHKMGMELPESSQRNVSKRSIKSLAPVMAEQPKPKPKHVESLISNIDGPSTPTQPRVKEEGMKDEKHQTFLYQLAQLPEVTRRLEERVEELHKAQRYQLDLRGFIEHLLDVERNMKKEDRLMEEIDRLNTEIDSMQNEIIREKDKLERREKELIEVYKVFNSMLTDFMNLESVAKLTSLGDFMKRLEVTVDQFGTVLKSKRI